MKRLIVLISTVALVFGSCKKEGNIVDTPPPTGKELALKTIVYQHLPSPYYQFEYDVSGNITKAGFASGAFFYDVQYDGNHIREMKSTAASTKIRTLYEYDNTGKIVFIKIISEDGSAILKRCFLTYDELNRLKELEWETNSATGGFILQRTVSFSYYADGNVFEKKDQRHFIEGKQSEALYIDRFEQYDNKLNVDGFTLLHETSEHLVLLPGVVLQRNNPGKNIRTGDGINYEITYHYSYNSDKYPLQRAGSMLLTNGPQAGQRFQLNASYSYYD